MSKQRAEFLFATRNLEIKKKNKKIKPHRGLLAEAAGPGPGPGQVGG